MLCRAAAAGAIAYLGLRLHVILAVVVGTVGAERTGGLLHLGIAALLVRRTRHRLYLPGLLVVQSATILC
jgi:hypothetical protein